MLVSGSPAGESGTGCGVPVGWLLADDDDGVGRAAAGTGVEVVANRMPLEVATSLGGEAATLSRRASRGGGAVGMGFGVVVVCAFSTRSTLGKTNCMGRFRR